MNRKFKTIAAAVLLISVAFLMGSCKQEPVTFVQRTKVLEVGETSILAHNGGKDVDWSVFYPSGDTIAWLYADGRVAGLKAGNGFCRVTATGRNGATDHCDVSVKAYIRPQTPLELYKDDTSSFYMAIGRDAEIHADGFYIKSIKNRGVFSIFDPQPLVVEANHVGETFIRFYDRETEGNVVDTGLLVKIQPRYPNYWQAVDFDDTQDSVRMKLGTSFVEDITDEGDLRWMYLNCQSAVLLLVDFDQNYDNALVKSYGAAYSSEETKMEVMASIKERCEYYGSLVGTDFYFSADVVVGTQENDGFLVLAVVSNSSKTLEASEVAINKSEEDYLQALIKSIETIK